MPKAALTLDFTKLDPIVAKYVVEFHTKPKDMKPAANNTHAIWLRDALSRVISKHRKEYELKEMELLRIPSGDTAQCIKKPLKLKEVIHAEQFGDKDYLLTNGHVVKLIEMFSDDKQGALRAKVEQLASITRRAAELGVGPKIYDFYICSMPSSELFAVFRMEHVKGTPLKEVSAKLTPEEKQQVIKLVTDKLDILHKNKIVYRHLYNQDNVVLIYKGKSIVDVKFTNFNGSLDINNSMDAEIDADQSQLRWFLRTDYNEMDATQINNYVVIRMLEDGHISVIE